MEVEAWGVAVEKNHAEMTRRILARRGLLEPGLRAARLGDRIVFPVRDPGEAVRARFESRRRPRPLEGPIRGYTLVGDIAVFSQTAGVDVEDYRRLARILVEEHPRVRSVWLKVRTEGEHRVSRLIHLAGEERTKTIAVEYGLRFHVDIARAYYNPRLAYEHRRVAQLVSDGEKVLDMFTGVGVFPVHIASQATARVVAVDLNPHAARLAAENARLNQKKLRGAIHVFHGDARLLPRVLRPVFDRIIMNLPATSLDFAREACMLASRPAVVHVYVRTISRLEAEGLALEAFESAGCRAMVESSRKALDYSPQEAVYAVDLRVE